VPARKACAFFLLQDAKFGRLVRANVSAEYQYWNHGRAGDDADANLTRLGCFRASRDACRRTDMLGGQLSPVHAAMTDRSLEVCSWRNTPLSCRGAPRRPR